MAASARGTTHLVPLLARRRAGLSREQAYRLVARIPKRLSLTRLASLCGISLHTRPISSNPTGSPVSADPRRPGPARLAPRSSKAEKSCRLWW
nr:helix-turn-helix domain-containing protein [Mycobacterium riyadhense]